MTGIVPPFRFEFRMRKMILGKRERSSRKSALEVLSIYFHRGQKKDKKESRNDEAPFFHAFWMTGNHLPKELIEPNKDCQGTSLKFSAIVWKIRNRINKFVDSRGKK